MKKLSKTLSLWHETCKGVSQDAPTNCLLMFSILASGSEGISVSRMVKQTGLSQSSVSRNMRLLTDQQRAGRPGLGLAEWRRSDTDFRIKEMYLTQAGQALAARMKEMDES